MPEYSASKPISFRRLVRLFLFSRGGLCLTAVVVGIACRLLIPKPFRWFEALTIPVMLLLWPRIELFVHSLMHNAPWSGLYHRHQYHHKEPHDDTALGVWPTFILYNMLPIPWVFIHWAWAVTLLTTILAFLMFYEFVHVSTHYRYRPRTEWGKRVRRNHLLHHRDPTKYLEVIFPRRSVDQS